MRSLLAKIGVAVVASLGLVVGTVGPASADAGVRMNDYCHTGYFCGWYLNNYQFTPGNVSVGWFNNNSNWGNATTFSNGQTPNNNTWSWYNAGFVDTFDDVKMYDGTGYGTFMQCFPRNTGIADWVPYRDRASSHQWVTTC
jgi:hypothetical protein